MSAPPYDGGDGGGGVPRTKSRFGRLKRSQSHDEDSPAMQTNQSNSRNSTPTRKNSRNFFKKTVNDMDRGGGAEAEGTTTTVSSRNKQSRATFAVGRRRCRSDDGAATLQDLGQLAASSAVSDTTPSPTKTSTFAFAKKGRRGRGVGRGWSASTGGGGDSSVDTDEVVSVSSPKKGSLFRRGRRKSGDTARARTKSASGSDCGSYNGAEVLSDEMSSDNDHKASSQCNSPKQQQQLPQDSTILADRPRNVSAPRSTQGATIDMMPLRKMVSFDEASQTQRRAPRRGSRNYQPAASASTATTATGGDPLSASFEAPSNNGPRRRERARYNVQNGGNAVQKKFRVRPYKYFSDPAQYMTEQDIYMDSLTPSKQLVPLVSRMVPVSKSMCTTATTIPDTVRDNFGSPTDDGRIGAIKVEILGCVGLNRTKPDVAVFCICGDAAFCTDIIAGYRSPMWPSPSRRACTFPIHHAYAKLYVGVFDVRSRKNKENDVFCGRVAIDIASIRPGTEYDTTLPLRASNFVYDKRKRGVIRVRFSMHWFNERAAVVSYFKPLRKNSGHACSLIGGQPGISCADPKTFRNVAVTVYGQDLPGKYSRNAFRATMREFNLYQQNIQLMFKVIVLDAMMYEKPWMSLYLFGGAMYCVGTSSVRLVPAIVVGYTLFLYIENYVHFVRSSDFHLGYKPMTIYELFMALILNTNDDAEKVAAFEPIDVEKRTKRRRGRMASRDDSDVGAQSEDDDNNGEVKALDHREFPFSDRDAYPNFAVEEALAPGSSKGGAGRLHGRLSVYYTPDPSAMEGASGEDDDSEEGSDHDDETVMSESQMMGDTLFDLDSDEEEEMNDEGADFNYKRAKMFQSGVATSKRRIKLGPPQDTDVSGSKKVAPHLQLKRVENMLYKASMGVSVEVVHPTLRAEQKAVCEDETGMTPVSPEVKASVAKKAQKITFDDFDKLLGLQSRTANPVHRIMSSFMGPLMRMIRVGVYIVRISFNVSTWRDPYLSFWVLVMLSSLCWLLIIFPWRSFFFLSSFSCLGPQNIFVRRYLEQKAANKEKEDRADVFMSDKIVEVSSDRRANLVKTQSIRAVKPQDTVSAREKGAEKIDAKRGFFAKLRHVKDTTRIDKLFNDSPGATDEMEFTERAPFQPEHLVQSSANKKVQPRAVVIPYSCVRKERFYDWPPDPTVSRATAVSPEFVVRDEDHAFPTSVSDMTLQNNDVTNPHAGSDTLRRRRSHTVSTDTLEMPTNITL